MTVVSVLIKVEILAVSSGHSVLELESSITNHNNQDFEFPSSSLPTSRNLEAFMKNSTLALSF